MKQFAQAFYNKQTDFSAFRRLLLEQHQTLYLRILNTCYTVFCCHDIDFYKLMRRYRAKETKQNYNNIASQPKYIQGK